VKAGTQRLIEWLGATFLSLLLASCAGEPKTQPEPTDGPSLTGISAEDVKDAQPRAEPRAPYGNNSPYEVFGKRYYVLDSGAGYRQRGIASWYGSKFHGRRTSSGEPYDMHLATAAHKTLPLPSYAEVTNLDNGRKVIVKINDRGPFKDDRLIDLSYGAALRLGMIGTGTAPVEVRVVDSATVRPATEEDGTETWLQAGAFGKRQGAEQLVERLTRAELKPASIHGDDRLFRVWLGPYASTAEIEAVIQRAIELGFDRPHRVKR